MIDWSRVADLRGELGPDDFDEVVVLFLEEADDMIARLTPDFDRSETERVLHFLKGSALNLGFQDLAALCQDGERAAAQGMADRVDLGAVVRCYTASKAAFRAGAGQAAA
jgi:HPt (histidine-containing phosphotransfer) domain-containing protein